MRQLLRSREMADACKEQAQELASKLGDAFGVSLYTGATRVNASVYTTDTEAIQDNLRNNTILKSLGVSTGSQRTGKETKGYYRTLKDGRKIYVNPHRRSK